MKPIFIKISIGIISFCICFTFLFQITKEEKEVKAFAKEEIKHEEEKQKKIKKENPKVKPVVEPKKIEKKTMKEEKFISIASQMANGLGIQPNDTYFSYMYRYGMENSIPPFLVAGVGWKESHYNPNAVGPETKYGQARGMFQFIDSTSSDLGYTPKEMHNPEIAIKAGSELLNEYSNKFFTGKKGKMSMRSEFYQFKESGQYATYKGKLVTDEKGKPLPRLLLGTMSYNSGPMRIVNSLEKYGFIVMNPVDSRWSLPHQTLQYVLLIDTYFYDFGYEFHFNQNDIDTVKVANNQ